MSKLEDRFKAWDAANPDFYHLFEKFTLEVHAAGRRKVSAWLIANRIRWEAFLTTTGSAYKVPNDFIALFARKFMKDHPGIGPIFNVRPMTRV